MGRRWAWEWDGTKEGRADGWRERGRDRRIRRRWAGQRDVKKEGVVVNLYNHFMAFKNGFKERARKIANFSEGFEHNRFIALKEWF